jgi:hypothetical protein
MMEKTMSKALPGLVAALVTVATVALAQQPASERATGSLMTLQSPSENAVRDGLMGTLSFPGTQPLSDGQIQMDVQSQAARAEPNNQDPEPSQSIATPPLAPSSEPLTGFSATAVESGTPPGQQ